MEFDAFKHSPLSTPTSIRLIRVVRATEKHSCYGNRIANVPLIQCELETVDLQSRPTYSALSYTWGSPRIASVHAGEGQYEYNIYNWFPILLNGRLLYIRKNLHDFMRQVAAGGVREVNQHYPYGKTDLHDAAENGRTKLVKLLIHRGMNVHITDVFGETALHYAAENGHPACVASLVAAGADLKVVDGHGRTPLQCAEQQQRGQWMTVVDMLREAARQTANRTSEVSAAQSTGRDLTEALWIDAICINQSDLSERSSQVALFPQIYETASLVLVWLGALDIKDTDMLVHWIMTNTGDKRTINALMMLMMNSYFTRLWVFQELNLAKNVKIMYGDYLLDWNCILRLLKPYMASMQVIYDSVKQMLDARNGVSYERPDAFLMARLRLLIAGDPVEQDILSAPRRPPARLSLPLLLALTWELHCGDPRDAIYALLSIATPVERPPHIPIDYARPVEEIYLAAAHHFFRGSGDEVFKSGVEGCWEGQGLEPLQALSYIQRGSKRPRQSPSLSLPSWVPDLSTALATRLIFHESFSAASQIPLVLGLDVDGTMPSSVLRLSGLELDSIHCIEVRSSDVTGDLEPDEGAWLDIALHLSKIYPPTNETRCRAFISTMNAGRQDSIDELLPFCKLLATTTQTPRGETLVRTASELQAVVRGLLLPGEELPSKGRMDEMKPGWIEEAPPYLTASMRFCNARRFFVSDRGYLGLGPGDMQEGDAIVLVAGTRVPFIMRRCNNTDNASFEGVYPAKYSFVGEAYVHGVMHGEAATMREDRFAQIELE